MLARERALRIALAEARAGVLEKRENFSKRIKQYQAADSFKPAKDTGYPWCNSFVVWCYQEARRKLTETGFSAGVATTMELGARAGLKVRRPARGDIVGIQVDTDEDSDHVGLVLEVLSDGSIRTVEGNTSGVGGDGVFVKVRPRSVCLGFLRVPGEVANGIGRGDHGNEVRDLQKQLVELGHKKLEVDGDFGEKTEKAVEQFQKKHDLEETGVAGSKTLAAITKELKPPKPEPEPEPRPAPKAAFVVTAAFGDGKPKEVNGLTTRTALNKQVGTFLDDGARFVQVSPES
jgi:Putative peptidoglycan binding domain/CHAP domain